MGWGKVAAWSTGIIVGVAAGGVVAFHALVDSETLARHARDRVRDSWSRELQVGGMSLRLLPRPSLHATQVTLSNAPWAKEAHFLRADSLRADFELLPLLLGRVEARGLTFENAVLNLESGPEGTNFPRRGQARPVTATADATPLPRLKTIRVRNATVTSRSPQGQAAAWTIESADLTSDGGLRNVDIAARLGRHRQLFDVKAHLDDASRWGTAGEVSQGTLDIKGAQTELHLEGKLPLQRGFEGHRVKGTIKAASLAEAFAFMGIARKPSAAFNATFESRHEAGRIAITQLSATLGKLTFTGVVDVTPGERTRIDAKLAADRLDWAQAFLDSGGTIIPNPPTDQLYSDRPMAWTLVRGLDGKEGVVDLHVKSLKLRNGIELRATKARFQFRGDNLEVKPFSAEMLGGTVTGTMAFGGAKKSVRIQFEGRNLLLERWLKERGSKVPFTGGPMAVTASITGRGDSMQDVASSITGPVTVRMGRGTWHSERAGEIETLMINVFAPRDAKDLEFACLAANLPFKDGRATAQRIIGARSQASRLIASGTVDFREGQLDLRGKVEAAKGVTLGVSAIANDIVIHGPLRKPRVELDKAGTPAALARVGAAIATAGVSLLGTALAEAASEKNDPCELVFK